MAQVSLLGSVPNRGRCPVEHRGEILSVRPSVHLSVRMYVPLHRAGSGYSEAGSGCAETGSGCSEAGSGCSEAGSEQLRLAERLVQTGIGLSEAGFGYLQAGPERWTNGWTDRQNFPSLFYRTSCPIVSAALHTPSLCTTAYGGVRVPLTSDKRRADV